MKRTAIAVLAVLTLALVAVPAARAERGDEFQAIQKAVKQNPAYEPGKEAQWFKVLITDQKTRQGQGPDHPAARRSSSSSSTAPTTSP